MRGGPVVTIGLGGIWIEALRDIRLLAADLDRDGIIEELLKLKGAALFRGHRGAPAADLDAVADCVLHLGAIMRSNPGLAEIEINPLVVYPKGALALDVLMHFRTMITCATAATAPGSERRSRSRGG